MTRIRDGLNVECPQCGYECFPGSKLCRPCYRARGASRELLGEYVEGRIRRA